MSTDDIAALNGGQPVATTEQNTGGRDFEPMPAGWYPVECKKSEIRDTKNKQGKYLWLDCDVIGDHYAGRKLFPRFNLVNPNAKAVEIGQRDLGFLGQSIGKPTGIKGSQELLGQQFDVRVKIKQAEGDYPADNEVTAYAKLGEHSSKPQTSAPAKASAKAGQARAWDKPPEKSTAEAAGAVNTKPEEAPAAKAPVENNAPVTAPAKSGKRPWEK